jgi:hypothetical protein
VYQEAREAVEKRFGKEDPFYMEISKALVAARRKI